MILHYYTKSSAHAKRHASWREVSMK